MVSVSVVVPAYNVEKYLEECLQSILMQTYIDYEIIIVNDGSTDSSLDICNKYKEQSDRVKVFTKENGGLSSARNYGVEKSEGKYIIFVDSDDYWISEKTLEKLVFTAQTTDADIVRGEYLEVDDNGSSLYIPELCSELTQVENMLLDNCMFVENILSRGHFSWLFLIKKDSIQNQRFNENHKFQEDIEFNIRYFSKPRKCVYIPFRFYAYRKRENSIMSTFKVDNLKYSFDLVNIWHYYSERISENELSNLYSYNAIMMYYSTLETISQAPYYNNCLSIIEKLSLVDLNKKVRLWANSSHSIYPLPVYVPPLIGVYYFRLKHIIGSWLRKIKLR